MPELPEIHTIVTDLKKYATNAKIVDVEIEDSYTTQPHNKYFVDFTKGFQITKVRRLAKNIVVELSSEHIIVMHLAMTGRLLLRKPDHPREPHERVRLVLNKKGKGFHLRFADMRKFGKVQIIHKKNMKLFEDKYGIEPIDEKINANQFLAQLHSKNTSIKNVLLDQQIISGLGNVYATDALWIARIHPETATKNMDRKKAEELLLAAREILNEGIKNRGISMSDYVDLFERKGRQQEFFRIYRKEKCPRCETKTVFKKISGRGTYFCEKCQPKLTPLFS